MGLEPPESKGPELSHKAGKEQVCPRRKLPEVLVLLGLVQSIHCCENQALNYSSPSSESAPFCDPLQAKTPKQKRRKAAMFALPKHLRGKGSSCEEPSP